ncbi:MAG: hypothetical protein OEZ20_03985 [candidate division WOR-3 bacterium]|nr:hypothetical protein [candidate division WOR-3 bacterium]MDH5683606.1 hypothetical protein [candidate division WOR-3 bacterium]
MRYIIAFLLIFPISLQSKEYKKSKLFGVIGISSGILAVLADVGVETFYDKYEKAKEPDDCTKYRNLTQRCENIRDGSFYLSALSFTLSSAFLIFEKNRTVNNIEFGFGTNRLWLIAKKSF